METTPAKVRQLLARLAELHEKTDTDDAWRVEQEPHDYADGTTHFTHVRTTARAWAGVPHKVTIGSYLTPELAELLVLMRNNLPDLLRWAQAGLDAAQAGPKPEQQSAG